MQSFVSRTPHSVNSIPTVKSCSSGASMWISPLVACVWSGENRLWSSRPMLEATGSDFPFTKMSTCEW